MDQHGGVGDVHVVRAEDGRRVRGDATEGGQAASPRSRFGATFRGVEDARAVGHARAVEGECLDHAVAIEPVAVAVAEALVLGGTVPPQDPREFSRQAAPQWGQGRGEFECAGAGERQEPWVLGQRRGEVFLQSGPCTRRQQQWYACGSAQRIAARKLRVVHFEDSGHRIGTTMRAGSSSGPMDTVAASKLGGPMKPRAPLEKP